MSNKIVAVVVTYNRKQLLKECIAALLKQTYKNCDVLVIDNCSTDGTERLVKTFTDERLSYINTGKNLGGAGGFQYGIREALKRNYDYLWLMDDDSIPTSDALEQLVNSAEQLAPFGFLSSKVLWKDHSLCNMNIPKVSLNHKLAKFSGSPQPIIMATFVSFFVPAKVVKEVGLPIKEFFIWADDLEFSRRISLKYKCYFIPNSVIIHKCKSNNGSNIVTDSTERLSRYKYAYRNEVYVYRREGIAGWNHLFLKTALHITKVLLKSKSEKKERLKIIIGSTKRGLDFDPQIEYFENNESKVDNQAL